MTKRHQNTISETVSGHETPGERIEPVISYIDSEDFRTLTRQELMNEELLAHAGETSQIPPDTPPYLASLYRFPLLTREQEYVIFRKMNFLRYEAALIQQKSSSTRPSQRTLQKMHLRLEEAQQIRNRIVQSNLRLVVSIAKNMVDSANSLESLISDGNLPLIRAVEIFDFTRGLRFSTYATWAIRNGLYRTTYQNRRQQQRFRPEETELLASTVVQDEPEVTLLMDHHQIDQWVERLEPRSRAIVQQRYGLAGKTPPAKFRELAAHFQLSSERVRQLLERALGQLRELSAG